MTNTWPAVGRFENSDISALAVLDGRLYAGGRLRLQTDGGEVTTAVAYWDPGTSAWSAVNAQADGDVLALIALNGKLYAGGGFTSIGGADANLAACWDPATQTWLALGSGMEGEGYGTEYYPRVSAFAVLNGKLYAGGRFTTAGEAEADSIACWDPVTSTWSTLGSGPGGDEQSVFALAAMDGKLYVGGYFAADWSAEYIRCWDPAASTWSALGVGTYGTVFALASENGKLYAGGSFASAGGSSANRIACWDPLTSSWSALGVGIGYHSVCGLAFLDGTLHATGSFTTAGGHVSAYWARWGTTSVEAFAINNGDATTVSRIVSLNHTCWDNPVACMASEDPSFSGALWRPYSSSPSFTLSPGNGQKTVYLKVWDSEEESAVVSDSITLSDSCPTWYRDADADGYGNPKDSIQDCGQPAGYVTDGSDCDDTDETTHPGAQDVANDGIDQDCSGSEPNGQGRPFPLGLCGAGAAECTLVAMVGLSLLQIHRRRR
ncbi:MAG: hypothetical protein GX616_12700 [Planctomycetes bacterium]|nr:hypothetical protein [Planctomycetota bacterium]